MLVQSANFGREYLKRTLQLGPSSGIILWSWRLGTKLVAGSLLVQFVYSALQWWLNGKHTWEQFLQILIAPPLVLALTFLLCLVALLIPRFWNRRKEQYTELLRELSALRIELEARPFKVDSDKCLYYRGRRNVAFGCKTINETFSAFVKEAEREADADCFLHSVGYRAGAAFARDFNKYLTNDDRSPLRGQQITGEDVLAAWEEYDDNAGFGDIVREKLVFTTDGVAGEVQVGKLFTTAGNADPWLCFWMCGYLEGFFNNALQLCPAGKHVSVSHLLCPNKKNSDRCVFGIALKETEKDVKVKVTGRKIR